MIIIDSMLKWIRKTAASLEEDDGSYDSELILHMNGYLRILAELGVPVLKSIVDETDTWSTIFGETPTLDMCKEALYLKVKLMFDPPGLSFVIEEMNKSLSEYQYRIKEVQNDLLPEPE